MSERKLLYEGKAKKVFEAEEPETLVVSYKDDATAFNGLKKGTITGKGEINNRMSNLLMQMLEKSGIPTHFIKELSPRETLVKKSPHTAAGSNRKKHSGRLIFKEIRR